MWRNENGNVANGVIERNGNGGVSAVKETASASRKAKIAAAKESCLDISCNVMAAAING